MSLIPDFYIRDHFHCCGGGGVSAACLAAVKPMNFNFDRVKSSSTLRQPDRGSCLVRSQTAPVEMVSNEGSLLFLRTPDRREVKCCLLPLFPSVEEVEFSVSFF